MPPIERRRTVKHVVLARRNDTDDNAHVPPPSQAATRGSKAARSDSIRRRVKRGPRMGSVNVATRPVSALETPNGALVSSGTTTGGGVDACMRKLIDSSSIFSLADVDAQLTQNAQFAAVSVVGHTVGETGGSSSVDRVTRALLSSSSALDDIDKSRGGSPSSSTLRYGCDAYLQNAARARMLLLQCHLPQPVVTTTTTEAATRRQGDSGRSSPASESTSSGGSAATDSTGKTARLLQFALSVSHMLVLALDGERGAPQLLQRTRYLCQLLRRAWTERRTCFLSRLSLSPAQQQNTQRCRRDNSKDKNKNKDKDADDTCLLCRVAKHQCPADQTVHGIPADVCKNVLEDVPPTVVFVVTNAVVGDTLSASVFSQMSQVIGEELQDTPLLTSHVSGNREFASQEMKCHLHLVPREGGAPEWLHLRRTMRILPARTTAAECALLLHQAQLHANQKVSTSLQAAASAALTEKDWVRFCAKVWQLGATNSASVRG
ncbi:MAG: hypothetical protein MHM6MM_002775 [Cercozoa sp. M6MM]